MSIAKQSAFPNQQMDGSGMPKYEAEEGLTKLEYFAGLAMQGMLSNSFQLEGLHIAGGNITAKIAKDAVIVARALIAELEKVSP